MDWLFMSLTNSISTSRMITFLGLCQKIVIVPYKLGLTGSLKSEDSNLERNSKRIRVYLVSPAVELRYPLT